MLPELVIAKLLENSLPRPKVNLIACMGKHGQLGLEGTIPWLKDKSEVVRQDLKEFQERTKGCVVVVGRNTWPTVASLDYTHDRLFLIDGADTVVEGRERPWDQNVPLEIARTRAERYGLKNEVWIAGGRNTYTKWFPIVDHMFVSYVDYDGPADVHFPWISMPRGKSIANFVTVMVDYRDYEGKEGPIA